MLELVTALLEKLLPYVIAGSAALAAFGVALWRARAKGAAAEKARQAAEQARAKNIADQVDNDVGALPAGAAREELKKWDPKR